MPHRYIEEDCSFDIIKRLGFFFNLQLGKYFSVSDKNPIHDTLDVMQNIPDESNFTIDEKHLDDNFISIEYEYRNAKGSLENGDYFEERYVACARETAKFNYKGIGECIWYTFYAMHYTTEQDKSDLIATKKGGIWYDAFCDIKTEKLIAFQSSEDSKPTFCTK